ncbi:hypothetical protein PspLS_03694 [Pyricularia sp. CBS 133598]|nr:hypothetical protein PspLS_03694 [Pyricularia sp. CBS 133598]
MHVKTTCIIAALLPISLGAPLIYSKNLATTKAHEYSNIMLHSRGIELLSIEKSKSKCLGCVPQLKFRPNPEAVALFRQGALQTDARMAAFWSKVGENCKQGYRKAANCVGLGKKAGAAKEAEAGEKIRAEAEGSNKGKE